MRRYEREVFTPCRPARLSVLNAIVIVAVAIFFAWFNLRGNEPSPKPIPISDYVSSISREGELTHVALPNLSLSYSTCATTAIDSDTILPPHCEFVSMGDGEQTFTLGGIDSDSSSVSRLMLYVNAQSMRLIADDPSVGNPHDRIHTPNNMDMLLSHASTIVLLRSPYEGWFVVDE
jgi:hypothetical protein